MVEMNKKPHPYLYFDRAWVERFRLQLQQNADLAREWHTYVAKADRMLGESFTDEAQADGEDSQHGRYGPPSEQVAKMGTILGLVYQVTGERHYGEKLREALLHYSTYQKWYGKGLLRNDPSWHSELNTSRFCHGYAVGYDCIYDLLSDEERGTVRRGFLELGVLPTLKDWVFADTRIHTLDSMGHNWWAVMIGLAGVGVLSVMNEEGDANAWLGEIVRIFPEYFLYKGSVLGNKSLNYDEAGAFYESLNYADYGLYEYLVFRLAYQTSFGHTDFSDIPVLSKAGDFFLHTTYPASERPLTVNFGDGDFYTGAVQAAKMLLANGLEDPRLRWYLKEWQAEYGFYDFIQHERIWQGSSNPPSEAETSVIYGDIGWVAMRDSWEKDRTLLAVKSGFSWNHAHADAGSFVLYHKGRALLIDSGNCSYERPEYLNYYVQSEAHNVVLFNGEGQLRSDVPRGVKEPGQVYHLVDHAGIRYVYADATGPMSRHFSRNFRHFLWVDDVIVIIDDVRAHEKGNLQWLMHFEGEIDVAENRSVRVTNGDASVIVKHLFPQDLVIQQKEGLADHAPDTITTYLSFETSESVAEAKFITAVIPVESGQPLPNVTALEGHEMIGVRILSDGKQTDVYLNLRADGRIMHQNCIRKLNGWETDAYLVAVTRPEGTEEEDWTNVERCFIGYGSVLRHSGHTLFASMSRATACLELSPAEVSVALRGQPYLRAEVRPAVMPQRVTTEGDAVLISDDNGVIVISQKTIMPSRRPG
ncbi:heparinase II/III domain-containing protein [Paenibacillus qinlingensis]|uniref:heparinase II/III domain-containing protein n=1 Tax=Paenibacillus qinlingensis TaxID=1837343 RepID=UPI001566F142|nr:heparinase II/III family protein [Paenibacillus qinlingensis]NQX61604.1 heparinase II/III family protein [Paenibacillus qinlingensis]